MNMHLVPVSGDSQSPFDTIKNISPDTGNEYWSARDLAPLMGYATTDAWKNFEKAINRAWMSAKNQGHDTEHHFSVSSKVIEGGRWGKQTVKDFHFTRFAAYLVAMNGDPNKPEVAAAQAYFAIQTHVAETRPAAPALPQDYATALRELASTVEAKELATSRAVKAESELEAAAPKIEYHDKFVAADDDVMTVGDWGAHYGLTQPQAFQRLVEAKIIYRKAVAQEFSDKRGQVVDRNEYRAYAAYRNLFELRAQHNAPRYHNGQVRQTLYVKAGWAFSLAKQPGLEDLQDMQIKPLL